MFAATLARHPAVAYVDYPGLPTHPGHELARRTFDAGPEGVRFGAIVTVTPYGGREAGLAFARKLRLAAAATSLGGTHTVVSHVASTTHRQLDDRALGAAGIDAGAVRFSIGLEDVEDLISDAYTALRPSASRQRRPAYPRGRHHGDADGGANLSTLASGYHLRDDLGNGGRGAWARSARYGSPSCSGGGARSTRCRALAPGSSSGPSTATSTTSCRSASRATGGGC